MHPLITFEQLYYYYPEASQPALQDISLSIQAGEFVLLAGPSGSGKSTLLRCLNGLVPHFSGGKISGRVEVSGENVLNRGPQALSRLVGFVFQNPESQNVLEQVEAEIAFSLENLAFPVQEMRLRVEEVLNLLDLADLRDRPLITLSGGERQRVAIAAAMALRPQILVLDEPTSQLDPQSAADVLQALVRLNEELGLTIILAEHRLERVARYADRLVYLDNGRIAVDAPVREAMVEIPAQQAPPLVRLGTALGWQPLPLTIKEGLRFTRSLSFNNEEDRVTPAGKRPSPETPSLLTASKLHFAYNGRPVLQGVDLKVAPGEVVALMGRNGSGKSTLLKCLVGLLRPSSGQINLEGRDISRQDVAEICRWVGYLPQNPDDLLFAESVLEELQTTLKNHGLAAGTKAGPIHPNTLLEQLGLAGLAQAYPRDLSVGQRQRVALGAVTITLPRLLLLDEPTRGLDFAAKRDLIAIWQHWQKMGMGILLVTHDVELVARIADRVLMLSQGEIIAEGPTAEILTASPLFTPQIARLFPNRKWLSVEDVLENL